MRLLAWDTSSKAGAIVALEWAEANSDWSDVRLAGEWSLDVDSRHSERLLWGIHQMLEAARWQKDEIDAFAVGVGPGSFTGLRIGVTTARTLAHALRKPLVGVSSLAALARPAALSLTQSGSKDALVIASTDACKGELFALWGKASSVARSVSSEQGRRDVREEVLSPEDLVKKLKPKTSWVVVGEGRKRYEDAWKKLPARREIGFQQAFSDQVQGRYLGMLAFEAYQARLANDALDVHPRYLRASDAELKLKSGVIKQAPIEAPR